ncbi:hypothetical protein SSP531S_29940 [Streptomyces spongiicola]|uniref:Uncharacterized protein n=1 Tax=Streptomyces spongiicola TaxID=1690221 RepID=A0A388T2X2_9ACTN|nr:hypothetical protein SSP531S_29940 [Streptomyces spongiicola]
MGVPAPPRAYRHLSWACPRLSRRPRTSHGRARAFPGVPAPVMGVPAPVKAACADCGPRALRDALAPGSGLSAARGLPHRTRARHHGTAPFGDATGAKRSQDGAIPS